MWWAKQKNMKKKAIAAKIAEKTHTSVKRVIHKEAGRDINCGDFKMLFSTKVNDWRFRGENDKIMTNFYVCNYLWGNDL